MTSETDIANRALSALGTRSSIASLLEDSNEARQCSLLFGPTRNELLRMAPWNCATNFNNLSVICAAPGTPENTSVAQAIWQKGIPPPPWLYEYAYPSDCLRPLWIVPQLVAGSQGGIPVSTSYSGGQFWNGLPVRFKVAIDQVTNGIPAVGGTDTKVILCNQQQALLAYIKEVTIPDIWDSQFQQALVAALAARLVFALTGQKELANLKIGEANDYIRIARAGDGNEGLTVNDVTPDWIRARGIVPIETYGFTPNQCYDWGPLLMGY